IEDAKDNANVHVTHAHTHTHIPTHTHLHAIAHNQTDNQSQNEIISANETEPSLRHARHSLPTPDEMSLHHPPSPSSTAHTSTPHVRASRSGILHASPPRARCDRSDSDLVSSAPHSLPCPCSTGTMVPNVMVPSSAPLPPLHSHLHLPPSHVAPTAVAHPAK